MICARREHLLQEVAAKCRTLTADVLPVVTDVSDEQQCKNLVAAAESKFGAVDVIILNAALSVAGLFENATPNDFLRHFNVNFMQAVYIIKAALPALRKSHGKVVAISSLAALLATYGNMPYAASKAALHSLMQNLRLEERNNSVDFVLLPIGEVNTATALGNMTPKDLSSWISPEQCAREITDIVASRRTYYLFHWGECTLLFLLLMVPFDAHCDHKQGLRDRSVHYCRGCLTRSVTAISAPITRSTPRRSSSKHNERTHTTTRPSTCSP